MIWEVWADHTHPHTRAIGGTFEFTFILPKPANSGNTRPRKRRANQLGRKTPSKLRQSQASHQANQAAPH